MDTNKGRMTKDGIRIYEPADFDGMAKAGVNSLVRSLLVEVAPDRITVNAIAPGLIATPITQKRLDDPAAREKSM